MAEGALAAAAACCCPCACSSPAATAVNSFIAHAAASPSHFGNAFPAGIVALAVLLFVATAFALAYFQPPPGEEGSEIDALRHAVAAASYAAASGITEALRRRARFPFSRSRVPARRAAAEGIGSGDAPAEHQAVSNAASAESERAHGSSKRGFAGVPSAGDRERASTQVVMGPLSPLSPASDCEVFLRQVRSMPVRLLYGS